MIYFDDVCFFRLDRGRVGIRVAVLELVLLPDLEPVLAGDLEPDFEPVLLPDLEGDLGGDAELCCTRSSRIRSTSMSSYEDCW